MNLQASLGAFKKSVYSSVETLLARASVKRNSTAEVIAEILRNFESMEG